MQRTLRCILPLLLTEYDEPTNDTRVKPYQITCLAVHTAHSGHYAPISQNADDKKPPSQRTGYL